MLNINKSAALTKLRDVDWSFASLSNEGIHSFHWYPATYLSAIPGTLIPHLTSAGETVLDPFSGSGTTGVEAVRLNRRYIGIDTNPVAVLMTQAKLSFPSPSSIRSCLRDTLQRSQALLSGKTPPTHPHNRELLGWYHPQTLESLNSILHAILAIKVGVLRTAMLAGFSSILKNCSSQGKHWGWVCDNVKPKPEEIVFKNATLAFTVAITEFAKAAEHALEACLVHSFGETRESVRKRSRVIHGDCVAEIRKLKANSIDLVSTSPPYYGVADYVKSQRLTFLWLDKDELSEKNLGFRVFEDLRATEAGARSNRHRADSHQRYMAFMKSFFEGCSRVLKRDRYMTLVVGESPSRTGTIEDLISSAGDAGFVLDSRLVRDIRPNRRRLMAKVKGEDILIFTNAGRQVVKSV